MEKIIRMVGQLMGEIGMDAKRASILNTLRKSIGQMKNVSIENVSEKFGGFAMIVNVKNNKLQTIRKVSIISNDFTSGGEHYLCEISFMDEDDNIIKTQMNEMDFYLGNQTAEEVIGIILNLSRASSEKYLTRMKNYGEEFVDTLMVDGKLRLLNHTKDLLSRNSLPINKEVRNYKKGFKITTIVNGKRFIIESHDDSIGGDENLLQVRKGSNVVGDLSIYQIFDILSPKERQSKTVVEGKKDHLNSILEAIQFPKNISDKLGKMIVSRDVDSCGALSEVECPIDKNEFKNLLAFLSLGSIGFPNQDGDVVERVVNYVGNILNMPITKAYGSLFCLEEAMINGGIFFIREANKLTPYQAVTLGYAISKGEMITNDGIHIKADPKFRVIATGSSYKEINHSLADRFASLMYLESAKEEEFVYA